MKLGIQGCMRVSRLTGKNVPPGTHLFWFYCPGCAEGHYFEHPRWDFNGDYERPTFSPSLVLKTGEKVCHLFLQEGHITFLSDSTHRFAGQVVALEPLPAWMAS